MKRITQILRNPFLYMEMDSVFGATFTIWEQLMMVLEQLFKFGSNFRNLGATNQFPPNYYEKNYNKKTPTL
jgi:hypothetical protein